MAALRSIPAPESKWEATVALWLRSQYPDIEWEREYRFHPFRRWRFDFAEPKRRIAIEIEGLSAGKSRHTSISGYGKDCRKYNAAAIHGWCVIRGDQNLIKHGSLYQDIAEAISEREVVA